MDAKYRGFTVFERYAVGLRRSSITEHVWSSGMENMFMFYIHQENTLWLYGAYVVAINELINGKASH